MEVKESGGGWKGEWNGPPFSPESSGIALSKYIFCYKRCKQCVKIDPYYESNTNDWSFAKKTLTREFFLSHTLGSKL